MEQIGGQNAFFETEGAYTGAVSYYISYCSILRYFGNDTGKHMYVERHWSEIRAMWSFREEVC